MSRAGIVVGTCVTVFSAVAILAVPRSLAAKDNSRSATPGTLVQMAYAAEVCGQTAVRDALVDQVLSRDPDNEKARWLAGQVQSPKGWLSAESAERSRSDDMLLQEYLQRREACGEDAASRLQLANWCRDHDMPDREKAHLTHLVVWHGSSPAVMARLGMVRFQGQWIPEDRLDEFRRHDDRQRRVERKWKPVFAEWKGELKADDDDAYEGLAERLEGLTDGDALPILEEMLSTHSEKAGLAVVGHLDGISSPESTNSLVRHAVISEFGAVRVAASAALRKRPKYNYIPILLGALVAPLEITVELPHGGTNYVRRTVTQRGMYHDEKLVDHHMQYAVAVRFLGNPAARALAPRLPDGLRLGQYVSEEDAETVRRNERVREALYCLTGETYREPEEWWNWWNDYIENENQGEKPTIQRHRYRQTWVAVPLPSSSCLAWGTPIATETGSRSVEEVLPGDKVLAQNSDTGQLEYKIVLQRTVQQLESMREISFGDDSITVTRGHQFWVVGVGWCMAKELKVGQRLHGLEGSKEITAIEERSDAAAYNLIVDDFATYFAGKSRVLLHDYTFPLPTGAVLPGYVPKLAAGY